MLAAILLLATYLQFTVVLHTEVQAPLRADASEYFAYAQNLSELGIYSLAPRWRDPAAVAVPDKVRPPGYPLFLRIVGRPEASERWILKVGLVQAALGVLTVALCYLVAVAFLRPGMSLLAALLCAINPWLATTNVYVLSESLFTFLLFGSLWLSLRALAPGKAATHALLAGFAWGLCSLVRSTTEFLVPALALAALVVPSWRGWRRTALFALLGFALAMTPWLVRNQFVPTLPGQQDQIVNSIVQGSYPGFRYQGRAETFGYPYRFDPDTAEHSRNLGSALGYVAGKVRAEPLQYVAWYLLGKPYYFLSLEDVASFDIEVFPLRRTPYYERFGFALLRIGSRAVHAPLVWCALLAMAGLAFVRLRGRIGEAERHACVLVALVLAYAVALHMAAAPFPRYAVPFRPLLYAMGLLTLQLAFDAWRATRPPASSPEPDGQT
jgi:4-amino-4-deoxy-L-arabinose transferase-like glycosyltransferase